MLGNGYCRKCQRVNVGEGMITDQPFSVSQSVSDCQLGYSTAGVVGKCLGRKHVPCSVGSLCAKRCVNWYQCVCAPCQSSRAIWSTRAQNLCIVCSSKTNTDYNFLFVTVPCRQQLYFAQVSGFIYLSRCFLVYTVHEGHSFP